MSLVPKATEELNSLFTLFSAQRMTESTAKPGPSTSSTLVCGRGKQSQVSAHSSKANKKHTIVKTEHQPDKVARTVGKDVKGEATRANTTKSLQPIEVIDLCDDDYLPSPVSESSIFNQHVGRPRNVSSHSTLKQDVRNDKMVRQLKADLKIELEIAKKEREELKGKLSREVKKGKALTDERNALAAQVQELKANLESSKSKIKRVEKEKEQARKSEEALRKKYEAKKADLATLNKSRFGLEDQLDGLKGDVSMALTENKAFKETISGLEMKLESVTAELEDARKKLEECDSTHSTTISELQTQLENTTSHLNNSLNETENLKTAHSLIQEDLEFQLSTTNKALQTARQELDILRRSSSESTSNSHRSHQPLTSDIKNQNIRKTYAKVKGKYDTLFGKARHILVTTKGMELSAFGEFGKAVRELRKEVENQEQDVVNQMIKREDGGDEGVRREERVREVIMVDE